MRGGRASTQIVARKDEAIRPVGAASCFLLCELISSESRSKPSPRSDPRCQGLLFLMICLHNPSRGPTCLGYKEEIPMVIQTSHSTNSPGLACTMTMHDARTNDYKSVLCFGGRMTHSPSEWPLLVSSSSDVLRFAYNVHWHQRVVH